MKLDSSRQPSVSVVVPIFNVERYLRQCLDSLVGQTLRDLEIICINDGSTDSSGAIAAEYAARDGRVRVVSKVNSGYGDSMNRGIAEARGRWIGICEPDDFCDKRMYAQLLRAGERFSCDFVKANYREHSEGASPEPGCAAAESEGSCPESAKSATVGRSEGAGTGFFESAASAVRSVSAHADRLVRACIARTRGAEGDPLHEVFGGFLYGSLFDPRENAAVLYTDPTIWTGLYRREFLERNGISFSPTPGASFQDASFAHQCWIAARRVVLLREGFYHYRIDNAASSVKSGAKVFAVCDEYDRSLAFARDRGGEEWRLFGPRLSILRFGVYVWNYNRIAQEFRPAFVERWIGDLVRADDEGLLDFSLMTPEYRALLADVLAGPEALQALYPDDIPAPPLR